MDDHQPTLPTGYMTAIMACNPWGADWLELSYSWLPQKHCSHVNCEISLGIHASHVYFNQFQMECALLFFALKFY